MSEPLTGQAPLLVYLLHEAGELLQVELHTFLCVLPALGLLQGLQLEDCDIGVLAFQHVRQHPPQRRVALVQHLTGLWEVGDLEHVEVLRAWGQKSARWFLAGLEKAGVGWVSV